MPSQPEDLRHIQLLSRLAVSDLQLILKHATVLRTEGDQIYAADTIGAAIGFAWSGIYRVLISGPTGEDISIRLVHPGGHFGEIPAFSSLPNLDYQLAVDHPGTLLLLAREIFIDLVFTSRPLCESVLKSIAQAAVLRADRIFEFATLDIRTRLLAELLRLSHRAARVDDCAVIKNAPTHQALAASVGTSREVITRILGELREEGLVDARYKTIKYLDYDRLRSIVYDAVGARPSYTLEFNETTH
jgi:CRP/FNR family cyclic AMP-dependent transcriptional regulator